MLLHYYDYGANELTRFLFFEFGSERIPRSLLRRASVSLIGYYTNTFLALYKIFFTGGDV
jgi:hypothetical protein